MMPDLRTINNEKERLKKIEVCAANFTNIPMGLSFYEIYLFLQFRALYRDYKQGVVDKTSAKLEKEVILNNYDKELKVQAQVAALAAQRDEAVKKSEDLRIELNKAETLEDKFKIAIQIIEVLTEDKTVKENLNVIKENEK